MKLLPLLTVMLAMPAAAQTTWYVDATAPGPGSGTLADPYPSISGAIAAPTTVSGDTVEVAAGTYLDSFDLSGKSIRIVGAPGPRPLVRGNGTDRYCTIESGEGPGTALEHLEFSAGQGGIGDTDGGALLVTDSSVEIIDCLFQNNRACSSGGAITARQAVVTIIDSEFVGNSARRGGALHGDDLMLSLQRCTFTANQAVVSPNSCTSASPQGGAIWVTNVFITGEDCEFTGNVCESSGGAMRARGVATGSTLRACVFTDNSSATAGAVVGDFLTTALAGDGLLMTRCTFRGNVSSLARGGAIRGSWARDCYFEGNVADEAGGAAWDSLLEGCTLVGNFAQERGGAAEECVLRRCALAFNTSSSGAGACSSCSEILQCTMIGNVGTSGSTAVQGSALADSIVWDNRDASGSSGTAQVASSTVANSIIQGDPTSVAGPPLLFDRENRDVRLLPGSPAIDAGSPSLPLDPDGSPADIGAATFDPSARIEQARYCDPKITSAGCRPQMTLVGPLSPNATSILFVDGLPSSTATLFLASLDTSADPSFFGGSLCVGGSIIRASLTTSTAATGCGDVATFTVTPAFLGTIGAQSGDFVFFQAWFRDVAQPDGTGVGLSDAVVATVQN